MTGFYIAQNERIQVGTNNALQSNVQTFIQLRIKRLISFVYFKSSVSTKLLFHEIFMC